MVNDRQRRRDVNSSGKNTKQETRQRQIVSDGSGTGCCCEIICYTYLLEQLISMFKDDYKEMIYCMNFITVINMYGFVQNFEAGIFTLPCRDI